MPIYEYRCKECGEAFEKMVRWSEADRTQVCPKCQSVNTQKQVSLFASGGSSGEVGGSGSSCGSSGKFS